MEKSRTSLYNEDIILSALLEDYPKYPEKVDLPLEEFEKFYFRSPELGNLSAYGRLSLAITDLFARASILQLEGFFDSSKNESKFIPTKDVYMSKLHLLEDYAKKTLSNKSGKTL